MFNRATGIAAQDVEKYRQIITTSAIADAAKSGGTMGEGLGAGLGIGMGIAMSKAVSGESGGASQGGGSEDVDEEEPSVDEVKEKLEGLKEMVKEGLITEEDYKAQKARLLEEL